MFWTTLRTALLNRIQIDRSPVDDHFERSCKGKVKYREESANRAVEAFKKRRNQIMEAYECEYCDGWHIGHPMPEKSIKIFGVLIRFEKKD